MISTSTVRGRIALMVAHCAGMLDLVALPVWVGTLIERYNFGPQQAGGLASIFLFGAVISSVILANRFHSVKGRGVAVTGFAIAALCFALNSQATEFSFMAILHGIAGFAAGGALSVTHGTIAQSANPHRMFAIVGAALGVFAIVFLGATPGIIANSGGEMLFIVFAAVMFIATVVSLFAFPIADAPLDSDHYLDPGAPKIPGQVWFGVVAISAMALVQAMTFSFLERVGDSQGFGLEAITAVLIVMGVVNLFPAILAAVLEKRIGARSVLLAGPLVQACLCFIIMNSTQFIPYAMAAVVFPATMIFVHTFAFGVLARMDRSGRALAATPAMLMVGAGIGPILGGSLIKFFNYSGIGFAAIFVALIAAVCFSRIFSIETMSEKQNEPVG